MTENVLLEIQKTFDFFKATASSDRIDRIVLSGGASRGRRLRRGARGALRRAGRACSIRSGSRVRRAAARHRRSRNWPRRPRWPWDWRSERQATGDQHQPPRREREGRRRRSSPSTSVRQITVVLRRDPAARRLAPSAGATGWSPATARGSTKPSRRAEGDDAAALGDRSGAAVRAAQGAAAAARRRSSKQLRTEQIGPVHMLDQISLCAAADRSG